MRRLIALFLFALAHAHTAALSDLSTEEKIGQLLMVYFTGEELNDEAKRLISEIHAGSFIYYKNTNDLNSPKQVQRLSNSLQTFAKENKKLPLIIATDEEGGIVSRLGRGFTDFPGNGALGQTDEPALALKEAQAIGEELMAVGINLDLAPVVDVNNNPENPVIGIRSFGANPEKVTLFGEQAVKGYMKSGVMPCLKHFPGYGDTHLDPHTSLPIVNKPLADLEAMELLPFMRLTNDDITLMSAHIIFPALDPDNPATLSKKIVTGLLRTKLKFNGVVITDSITMEGVLKKTKTMEEAALQAFEAGCDILCIGGRTLHNTESEISNFDAIKLVQTAFLNALKEGRITLQQLNTSVQRILTLKETMRLKLARLPNEEDITANCATQEHRALAREIALRAIHVKRGTFPLYIKLKKVAVVAPKFLLDYFPENEVRESAKETSFLFFDTFDPAAVSEATKEADYVLCFTLNAWKDKEQIAFLRTLASTKPMVLIATGMPTDCALVPQARLQLATYSPSRPSLLSAVEYITGKALPLNLFQKQAFELGMRIWTNECNQSEELLTYWKEGEEFPSLGIGHFIWPPQSYKGPFATGVFPQLLAYLKKNRVVLPKWLSKATFSPWISKKEFDSELNTPKMKELRNLLVKTIPHQASFMVEKLNSAFLEMQAPLSETERKHLVTQFYRIANTPQGAYVLVDYLNFKHSGIDPKERYNDQGWGLCQVLLKMGSKQDPAEDFVTSAKALLKQRIENSPKERNEARWWPGWENRLNTYSL